jgi:hypothetical protein
MEERAIGTTVRASNEQGFINLIELAVHILETRPRNAATTFAVRCLLREASLKAAKKDGQRARFISRAALYWRRNGQQARTVREHIVPLGEVIRLTATKTPTVKELAAAVEECRYVAIITKNEDRRLVSAGLKDCMPEGWDGVDKHARYLVARIQLQDCPPDIKY